MNLTKRWLALDIGGANVKIADGCGFARLQPFALWRDPEQLPTALRRLLVEAPDANCLAVTMTGELADCYETKVDGVRHILASVRQVAGTREVAVYLCDGRLVPHHVALEVPMLAAASNWHVLATFACRYVDHRTGLLIDIGSTTTDLVPLAPAGPATRSLTDPERLAAGELVYTGVERSPLCAVVRELPWRGVPCPIAQELFATTLDAYVILGQLDEVPSDCHTADGRPRTRDWARDRLARMICADRTMFSAGDAEVAAEAVRDAQLDSLLSAAKRILANRPRPHTIVISGNGEFLARALVERLQPGAGPIALSQELGAEASRCACAHSLAFLAAEGGVVV